MASDLWEDHADEVRALYAEMNRLYAHAWEQSRDLRLAYLDAERLPREVLIARLREALVLTERITNHAFRFTEASRRLDALWAVDTQLRAYREAGAKGGKAAAATTQEVRDEAIRLARERQPEGGWRSAPHAADNIAADLAVFARKKGRNPARRKVEEWLRAAGIKRRNIRGTS